MPATTVVTPREIEQAIRNVPDFPKPGIQFKDITPVLADARLFAGSIELLTSNFKPGTVDAVVGIDARESTILRFRFGLDGGQEKTLEEVGAKFGVTRERVRQIQNLALRKLRKMIEKLEASKKIQA